MSTTSSPRSDEGKTADPNAAGIRHRVRFLAEVLAETAARFSDNEGYRLGAAFSYYATFSIFPLLLLSVTFVGFFLGDSASARTRLLDAISTPGSPVRDVLDQTLSAMQGSRSARGLSAVVGSLAFLFGASGAFVELDAALNRIWCVPPRKSVGILGAIRVFVLERLSGFAIALGLGLTLLLSLVSSSILTFLAERAREQVEVPLWAALVRTADVTLSIALLSGMFTAAFHLIPRSRPPVRVVVGGAVVTTVLLSALKELFATYLSHLTRYSAYGVAGSVLALTTWIYVTSMILFFGAQLTRVVAEKTGAVDRCNLQYVSGCPPSGQESTEGT